MEKIALHIQLPESHPAYQWAKKQSDSVKAFGHIGTHIDCYTKSPQKDYYEVEPVVFDCRESMPIRKDMEGVDLNGKAVLLYTSTMESFEYGSEGYNKANTFFDKEDLAFLLSLNPSFLIIDATGIGPHGKIHSEFDKLCEKHNCFVIENVLYTQEVLKRVKKIVVDFDPTVEKSAKPCKVYAVC